MNSRIGAIAVGAVAGSSLGASIGAYRRADLLGVNTDPTGRYRWSEVFQDAPVTAGAGALIGGGMAATILHGRPVVRATPIVAAATMGGTFAALTLIMGASSLGDSNYGPDGTTRFLRGGLGWSMVTAPIVGLATLMVKR